MGEMLVAAVQMRSTTDVGENLATADRLVRRAAQRGAQLVVLPEKWPALGPPAAVRAGAQRRDGEVVAWARATARELGIDLVAGSQAELSDGEERLRNTSLHVGPDGEIRAAYVKLHLFDVTVDGVAYEESADEAAGDAVVVSEAAGGTRLGLAICYDLRFPELFRAQVARGARVLCLPSAFTLATTRDHWDVLVRARAIENQCFVIAANQVGEHAPGLRSGGRSMVVDAWGTVLAGCDGEREGIALAELDLGVQDEIRARLPALAHVRAEVLA